MPKTEKPPRKTRKDREKEEVNEHEADAIAEQEETEMAYEAGMEGARRTRRRRRS